MKPKILTKGKYVEKQCGCCNTLIMCDYLSMNQKYCGVCGTKIDWSDEE